MKSKQKKSTILYVLKILKEGSNYQKPISQSLIARTIETAGISCDRRTVSRDIDCLIEFGYRLVKVRGGGCYLVDYEQKFTVQDYRKVAGVIKVSTLTRQEKIDLCLKLKNLINVIE